VRGAVRVEEPNLGARVHPQDRRAEAEVSDPYGIAARVAHRSTASPAGFGSLVLAAYRAGDLIHIGSVGTCF
jgi:hypothetical protein